MTTDEKFFPIVGIVNLLRYIHVRERVKYSAGLVNSSSIRVVYHFDHIVNVVQ